MKKIFLALVLLTACNNDNSTESESEYVTTAFTSLEAMKQPMENIIGDSSPVKNIITVLKSSQSCETVSNAVTLTQNLGSYLPAQATEQNVNSYSTFFANERIVSVALETHIAAYCK